MTPAEALTGPAIRAAMEAHAEACRVALRETRPTPEMPANLRVADLRWANLSGANLSRANLSGADLRGAGARVWIGDRYYAYTVPSDKGRLLAFGCERHTMDVWERDVAAMCKKHEPDHAARYEAEIRALIALCRVVDMEKTK